MGDVDSSRLSLPAALAALAEAGPDLPAVTCGEFTLSRLELARRSNRLARAYASLGVGPGSMVTIGLPNGAEFLEAVVATWKLGAVPQPISYQLSRPELSALLTLVEPALVVGLPPEDVAGLPSVPPDFTPDSGLDDGDLPDEVSPAWKAPTSGGSTGRPKVIVAGEPGLLEQVLPYADLFRIPPRTTMLIPAPLYHNGPFMHALLTLLGGGHVVVMPRFDAEETLRLVAAEGVSSLYAVPTMMHRIWRLPEAVRASYDVSSLRTVLLTAAPCPQWLKEAWIDWLGPERIVEIYGGTEAQAMTFITGAEMLERPASIGRPALGEMRVFDETGAACPPGVGGEVWMRRGPDAPPTYHYLGAEPVRRPEGWEWLGDDGYADAEGYLYLADRRLDLILVGGANVYPAEVEAAIDEHPLVASSCVIGLPHPDLGAVPHAVVETVGSLDEPALREHLAGRLVAYKRPRSYEFVREPLRDDSGKVRRAELRDARLSNSPVSDSV